MTHQYPYLSDALMKSLLLPNPPTTQKEKSMSNSKIQSLQEKFGELKSIQKKKDDLKNFKDILDRADRGYYDDEELNVKMGRYEFKLPQQIITEAKEPMLQSIEDSLSDLECEETKLEKKILRQLA